MRVNSDHVSSRTSKRVSGVVKTDHAGRMEAALLTFPPESGTVLAHNDSKKRTEHCPECRTSGDEWGLALLSAIQAGSHRFQSAEIRRVGPRLGLPLVHLIPSAARVGMQRALI